MSSKAKVIFLDRDGVINIDHGFVHNKEGWEFTADAPLALKSLKDKGYVLAVVTNQSGIAAGMYKEADMLALHDYMQAELAKAEVQIDVIAYCPHARDSKCDCRKPSTGMAKQIEAKVGEIDYENSWTIGDKVADLLFGKSLGTHTILIRSAYWQEAELPAMPDVIAGSLKEVVELIK